MSETILQEADRIINGDRQYECGHPLDNHGCTARLWSAWLTRHCGVNVEIGPEDVCHLMILKKESRAANRAKRDHLVDIAGYAGNIEMIENELKRRGGPQPTRYQQPQRGEFKSDEEYLKFLEVETLFMRKVVGLDSPIHEPSHPYRAREGEPVEPPRRSPFHDFLERQYIHAPLAARIESEMAAARQDAAKAIESAATERRMDAEIRRALKAREEQALHAGGTS